MDWDSGQSKIEPGRIQSKKLIKRQFTCLHLVWGCCHGGYIQMILYGFAWVCRPTYQIIKDTPRTQCCLFLGHNFCPVWQQTFVDYSCSVDLNGVLSNLGSTIPAGKKQITSSK